MSQENLAPAPVLDSKLLQRKKSNSSSAVQGGLSMIVVVSVARAVTKMRKVMGALPLLPPTPSTQRAKDWTLPLESQIERQANQSAQLAWSKSST